MQINLLRQLGIAARFVATIILIWMSRLTNYTRGWTFYTGNGWLGLDPNGFTQEILIFQLLQVRT
jgi:transglutaminase-like putative cysteine protease